MNSSLVEDLCTTRPDWIEHGRLAIAAGGEAVDVEDVALEHRGRRLGDGEVDVAVDGVRHHRVQAHLRAHRGDGAHRLREPDVVAIEQAEAADVRHVEHAEASPGATPSSNGVNGNILE
jgi:hypothetical protein